MHWERRYYIIKTMGAGEALGFLSLVMPSSETSGVTFTLHRPEKAHTDDEFMDLTFQSIDRAEWETHIDAFETHKPLEVEHICWPSSTGITVEVLLTRKVNSMSEEDTAHADDST